MSVSAEHFFLGGRIERSTRAKQSEDSVRNSDRQAEAASRRAHGKSDAEARPRRPKKPATPAQD